jgi:hypothetical protein
MDKVIDFSRTVQQLCTEDSEIINILKDLGFENITNPGMLNTAGRFMTIPKGAAMKGKELETIKQEFERRGYKVKV